LLALLGGAPHRGSAEDYKKTIYFNNVAAGAGILGGAQVQTWSGKFMPKDSLTIVEGSKPSDTISIPYQHAADTAKVDPKNPPKPLKTDTINGGFPIKDVTGITVDTKDGWMPKKASVKDDAGVKNPSMAEANLVVGQRVPGNGDQVVITLPKSPNGTGKVGLIDSVKATVSGSAMAGAANDANYHSADSFGAVSITAAQKYRVTREGNIPTVEVIEQNQMNGAGIAPSNQRGQQHTLAKQVDPYFVTVTDQTDQKVTRDQVLSETLESRDATYSVDNKGIHLSIARGDPNAFVTLNFDSHDSLGWVQNPYTYGARLDASGLTAFGEYLPGWDIMKAFGMDSSGETQSGWSITMGTDTIDASYAFGPDGQPFDYAQVRPPDSFFTLGDEYTVDLGASDGAFVVMESVPEPTSFYSLGIALSIVFMALARRTGPRLRWASVARAWR
jgi:hypothetical protein